MLLAYVLDATTVHAEDKCDRKAGMGPEARDKCSDCTPLRLSAFLAAVGQGVLLVEVRTFRV